MVWHYGTTASSNARRDLLTKIVALATSQYVSAAIINDPGTGYTAGDMITLDHAGGYLSCKIEVLTVGGSGEILTFAIRDGGAYSDRVASVVVNAGGSGYVTGDVVRLTTGTFTEFAKLAVTAAAGAVTAATVFETGGAYSVPPDATASASDSDIGTGSGTGATFDVTMTGLIGTTAAAATGGTGSGATFDLTLDDTGWTAVWNRNDYSINSITDEKEVILQGDAGGGDDPLVGFRTYTATVGDTRYGIGLCAMDNFNPGLTFSTQINISPTDPVGNLMPCALMFDNAQDYWLSVNGRRIVGVIKTVGASTTSYISFYLGLAMPFGTQSEAPYPMFIAGATKAGNRKPDAGGFLVSGLTECFADTAVGPAYFRRQSDASWQNVVNSNNGTATNATQQTCYPLGQNITGSGDEQVASNGFCFNLGVAGVSQITGAAPTLHVMPSIGDDEILLIPVGYIVSNNGANTSETIPRGEMEGVYWIPGTKADGSIVASEDTIVDSNGDRFRIFANAHRSERYSYFAVKEA